ncbi:MAG: hypothetical protein WAV86_01020 [Lutibacter sp.]
MFKIINIWAYQPFFGGVPTEKVVRLFAAIFFSDKNLKKGFPLQSLTQFDLIINHE